PLAPVLVEPAQQKPQTDPTPSYDPPRPWPATPEPAFGSGTSEPSKGKKEAPEMELVIKNEVQQSPPACRFPPRTPEELEEQRRFEEQKRALEERAERLRKMSFNLPGNESA